MENFKRYVKERGHGESVPSHELGALLYSHPWFTTARLVERGVKADFATPVSVEVPELETIAADDDEAEPIEASDSRPDRAEPHQPAEEKPAPQTEAIIQKFLQSGEHRITPKPSTPEGDLSSDAPPLADGMVSEALAQIYVDQELWPQAREAYEKLRLAFPEKNAYFAEIIADLDVRSSEEASKNDH